MMMNTVDLQRSRTSTQHCNSSTRFLNYLLYQVGWLACVLGASWNLQWLGVSIALSLVIIHFWLATDRSVQINLALTAAAWGLLVDSAQLWLGVFTFPCGSVVAWLPPPFMAVLWLQFASTFRYSFGWLRKRYALDACFGLIGAPLAFYAGERLGAIEFLSPRWMNYAILGLAWAFSIPLLVFISDRLASGVAVAPNYRWPTLTPTPTSGEPGPTHADEKA